MKSVSDQIIDKLHKSLKQPGSDLVDKYEFMQNFISVGILQDDPRVKDMYHRLDNIPSQFTKD